MMRTLKLYASTSDIVLKLLNRANKLKDQVICVIPSIKDEGYFIFVEADLSIRNHDDYVL